MAEKWGITIVSACFLRYNQSRLAEMRCCMDTQHREQVDRQICANCGGTIRWNIARQRLECASCRTPYEIRTTVDRVEEHDFDGYIRREGEWVSFPETTMIVCGGCGAQIAVDEHTTATVCPMCGSTQLLEGRQEAGVPPDGVVPFRIDRETAQQNFSKWVKSRWFAPNRLKQAYQAGKLQGMYIPFWTFDAQVTSYYWGAGGTRRRVDDGEGKSHVEVRWRPVSGQVEGSYDDIQICAAQNAASQVVEKVLPYNTVENTAPFSPSYLSGFLAERYAIPATQAVDSARAQIQADQENQAEGDILGRGYNLARVDRVESHYHRLTYKHVLLPAWTSAFAYNGKQYMYIINGESGKVGGQRPYSVPKILAAVGVAVAAFITAVMLLSGAAAPAPAGDVPPEEAVVCQMELPWQAWDETL